MSSSDKVLRPRGYGLTAQLRKKQDAKFDFDLADDCMTWMKFVLMDGDYIEETESLPEKVTARHKSILVKSILVGCLYPSI